MNDPRVVNDLGERINGIHHVGGSNGNCFKFPQPGLYAAVCHGMSNVSSAYGSTNMA